MLVKLVAFSTCCWTVFNGRVDDSGVEKLLMCFEYVSVVQFSNEVCVCVILQCSDNMVVIAVHRLYLKL